MFVGDSFNWDGLVAVDRLMAQVLVGSYLALAGIVCFNLYIALLSNTFTDAYGQAQATALMQQATVIISVEKNLTKKQKIKFGHHMQNECSPLVSDLIFSSIQYFKIIYKGWGGGGLNCHSFKTPNPTISNFLTFRFHSFGTFWRNFSEIDPSEGDL